MTTPPRPRRRPARPAAFEVHVRMYRALEPLPDDQRSYRGLLGDCFLIRVVQGGAQSTILIDCGLLLGSIEAQARMQRIAADIVETCGGDLAAERAGLLDLLVVTHEHWDHISGFSQAEDVFFDPKKLKIANLWLGWTENPDDPDAAALRARFDRSGTAFAALAERLRSDSARFGADAADVALSGLEGFLGVAGKGGKLAGREIMDHLKGLATANGADSTKVSYREPGEMLTTPGANGLTTFVLAPPRNLKRLFKDAPSKTNPETYLDAADVDGRQLLRFSEGGDPDPNRDSPFARQYTRIAARDLAARPADEKTESDAVQWLRTRYYGAPDQTALLGEAIQRRRIDTDWLGVAGPLALKLDSDTNNTSLVLAFALPGETVMLFAADAQVGNWESWHDQDYPVPGGGRVTAETLLNRTRFYKVGHHGSHNATLKDRGLAMMTRDDLVAAIPTDEAHGKRQGRSGWQMPNPRVKVALNEATKGRILRNDRRYDVQARADDPELQNVDAGFFDRITETDLYLEYAVLRAGDA